MAQCAASSQRSTSTRVRSLTLSLSLTLSPILALALTPSPDPNQGAEAWRTSVLALVEAASLGASWPGLEILPAQASDYSLEAAGPLRIAVRLPLSLQPWPQPQPQL